jgi:CRP-like cAMP-binding protein
MEAPNELASDLKRHYLFSALSPDELRRVSAAAQTHTLSRGELLFKQGDPARRFFLVRSGNVKLYRLSHAGQEKVIGIMGPGRTFAEAAMFMRSGTYPVGAEALVPAEVVSFDNEVFRDTLRHSFDTCFRLMADLSVHLQQLLTEVEALALHGATFRVISYLLQEQPQAQTFHLTLPKHVIAGLLSITPETFSRVLANLREEGLIEVRGQEIVILNRQSLRRHLHG